MLLDENRSYLASLSPERKVDGAELYHGSPRDPVWEYVIDEWTAREALESTVAPARPRRATATLRSPSGSSDGTITGDLAPDGTEIDLAEGRWLLNPGSVGQPRDGDPRAAWLQLDLDSGKARFRRVAYEISADAGRAQGA